MHYSLALLPTYNSHFKSLLLLHGCPDYSTFAKEFIILISRAIDLRKQNPLMARIDLLSKLEVSSEEKQDLMFARVILQAFKIQKVNNSVSETMGKICNLNSEGVRLKMGVLQLENLLRLHHMPPMAQDGVTEWCEKVRYFWELCGGQSAICPYSKKRRLREEAVLPKGKEKGKSSSSRNQFSRYKRSRRYMSLLSPHLQFPANEESNMDDVDGAQMLTT